MPLSHLPYWRLSGFYFFYFACLGILLPYWSLYLKWEGFSPSEIGELTAILMGSRIIAPNIWGWLADHHGKRMQIVRLASFISIIVFAGIFIDQSFLSVALILMLFSFFWNASLPQVEVTTLQHLGEQSHYYSKIRLWGSIGFIVIVIILGNLLEHFEPSIIPVALLISITGIWLFSLSVPDSAKANSHTAISLRVLLKRPSVIAFLVICFLMQASHGPYYTFYTIYLEQYNYSSGVIGSLWALGVISEVVIFLIMHRWLPKFGLRNVFMVSLILTSLRWILIALFPQNLPLLLAAQILHAASYGSFHAAAIAWVHRHFIGQTQGRGQALYSSASFGVGGVVGSLYSGYLWDSPGAMWTFIAASVLSFFGALIAYKWLNERDQVIK